jgi:hypothetical protein
MAAARCNTAFPCVAARRVFSLMHRTRIDGRRRLRVIVDAFARFRFRRTPRLQKKKKSPSAESNLTPPARWSDVLPTAPTPPGCRDDRRAVRCRCAWPSSRACGRLRTNPLLDARQIVDNFRTPSPIFAIFFCSVSPTRRAPYCREFRASVPRRRRVRRRPPASIGFSVASRRGRRVVPRRRPRRPNRSSDRDEIFRPGGRRVAASDRRVSSLCVDGDRSADGSERCPRIVRFSTFSLRFSNLTFRPTGPDRRRSRRRVGRLRPRPSDVVSTGVAARFFEPSSKNAVFARFSAIFRFLSPADRPLRVGGESRLAPRRAPTPGVRRREPCALLGGKFLWGAKNRFSPTLGAPPESPFPRTLSGRRFSSLPPRRSPTAKTASESDPVWRFYLSEAAEFRTLLPRYKNSGYCHGGAP